MINGDCPCVLGKPVRFRSRLMVKFIIIIIKRCKNLLVAFSRGEARWGFGEASGYGLQNKRFTVKSLTSKRLGLQSKRFKATSVVKTKGSFSMEGVKIGDFEVIDSGSLLYLKYNRSLNKMVLYKRIENLMRELESVNSKGFINTCDVREYPVIKELAEAFTTDSKFLMGKDFFETYKWVYNIIILNLYYMSVDTEESLKDDSDLSFNFRSLRKRLHAQLDPAIRKKLLKRGVTVSENIYTGFDTEYKNIDVKYNKLLSVQLAVNTACYLKIPCERSFKVCILNPLSSEEYDHEVFDYDKFDYIKTEQCINLLIEKIRNLKFKENDESLRILKEGLIVEGIPHIKGKDFITFKFPRTPIEQHIYFNSEKGEEFSFKNLINLSNKLGHKAISKSYTYLINLLKSIYKNPKQMQDKKSDPVFYEKSTSFIETPKIKEGWEESSFLHETKESFEFKKRTRYYLSSFSGDRVSVTRVRNNYFIAHSTSADLSMMSDFNDFKKELNIISKSYVTLGKPFIYNDSNIIVRDTMLLTPAVSKSLEGIGNLYGEHLKKVVLDERLKSRLDVLISENKKLFVEYALKDALIALVHANSMEDFYFKIGEVGVPLTISSLSEKYVKYQWKNEGYKGYQVSKKFLLGDTSKFLTPKGLAGNLKPGLKINYYIANYKGGRNESFMYGADFDTVWYDYDLVSAYTTVMSACGDPDYSSGRELKDLNCMSDKELLYSYTIINCKFNFKESVKYPSIPVYLDENAVVYPLKGEAVLTGAEYLQAKKQGCEFNILEVYSIPFKRDDKGFHIKPFESVVKELQFKRYQNPKGSLLNQLYKQINNSIYGLIVKGINEKRKFDIRTGQTVRMGAGVLSNPIIASWVTAFVRSLIGESLHSIKLNDGKVVSVTTDGFITNLENLEGVLKENFLMSEFKRIRKELSGSDVSLEVKHAGKGIISWTTRGQLSVDANIRATTGFQVRNINLDDLKGKFLDVLSKEDKSLEYIQFSLRSAKDIYVKGGHVTSVYKDQIYRLHYDNRRLIQTPEKFEGEPYDLSKTLLDSVPVRSKEVSLNLRNVSKMHKVKIYNKNTSGLNSNIYKDYTDLAIRNFIKCLVTGENLFNLDNRLKTYSDIINFIKSYKPNKNITKQSISNLKNRKVPFKSIPLTSDTVDFANYIKRTFENFDIEGFLNFSGETRERVISEVENGDKSSKNHEN